MKRCIVLAAIVAMCAVALLLAERQKAQTRVGPQTVLGLIADTEHEMSRVPARLTRISDEQEIRIGDQMAERYLDQLQSTETTNDDRVVQAYVERVGRRVSFFARRKLPYRFHYIPDSNVINAFSLPGGHVFIGRGMLNLMTTEDELAAVLGHEIEHIDLYHCVERVQLQAHLRKLHMEDINDLVSIPIDLFKSGYNKDQELDADRAGTRLAMQASYSPEGAISMFRKFGKLCQEQESQTASTPEEGISQLAWETLKGYFQSHPPAQERIEQIEKLERESKLSSTPQRRLDAAVEAALHQAGDHLATTDGPPRILR
jgi:predicted Zn-dependent protease